MAVRPEGEARIGCQARPIVSQRGWREEDVLCASSASTSVQYNGTDVPVCRIHESMYARWAGNAAENARVAWGWLDG